MISGQSTKGDAVVIERIAGYWLTLQQLLKQVGQRMTGLITQLYRDRGVGTLLGEDAKSYTFRRSDVRRGWFHDLTEGGTVAFQPDKNLSATRVRSVSTSD